MRKMQSATREHHSNALLNTTIVYNVIYACVTHVEIAEVKASRTVRCVALRSNWILTPFQPHRVTSEQSNALS